MSSEANLQSESPATPSKPAPRPQLRVWTYAGFMVTYWCNARCAFCYVHSAPNRGGDMPQDEALAMWRGLDQLAAEHGKTMRIHLAGGEPFGDWPRLLSLIRAARDAGLTPLEKVETNAYWATQDGLTRARFEQLDALGMEKLIVSSDVYHQEFIPFERVERCVRIAREVLGRGRVRVRWWDFFNDPLDLRKATAEDKRQAYYLAMKKHWDRLTGRAAEMLGDLVTRHPAEHFANEKCPKEILHSDHVHIGPEGHVFPGVCAGIIMATVNGRSMVDVWEDLHANWPQNPVLDAVVTGGSYELMQRAKAFGYVERESGYASKCHLCTDVRQFLFERGIWPEAVGPKACYADETDRKFVELTHG